MEKEDAEEIDLFITTFQNTDIMICLTQLSCLFQRASYHFKSIPNYNNKTSKQKEKKQHSNVCQLLFYSIYSGISQEQAIANAPGPI